MFELVSWLQLDNYNTRVVLLGTSLLGLASGVVGTFLVLRKRALVGDVASHAALPGVGLAYLIGERVAPGTGKWLPGLLVGAAITAALGLIFSQMISRIRRIREDAALAITLSLFFGGGVTLFTMIQGLPSGQAAGLNDFVFGKAASMLAADVQLIAVAAAVVLCICWLLQKELTLLCFDAEYAAAGGWPVGALDLLLTSLVIVVTVLGMQSVGLLLVVALLVLPTTAAQFWTHRLGPMQLIAAGIGAFAAGGGVLISAAAPRLAAGAVIVLTASAAFGFSLLFGRRKGLVWQWLERRAAERQIGRDDLLRSCFEILEPQLRAAGGTDDLSSVPFTFEQLQASRGWGKGRLRHLVQQAMQDAMLRVDSEGAFRLTGQGRRAAVEAVRRHRLWELYLIQHADAAPEKVDRNADAAEHLLRPDVVEQLETLLKSEPSLSVPQNPHGR